MGLLGPYVRTPLPGGWRLQGVSVRPTAVYYRFGLGARPLVLILGYKTPDSAARSQHFSLTLKTAGAGLSATDAATLQRLLFGLVRRHDQGFDPWLLARETTPPRYHEATFGALLTRSLRAVGGALRRALGSAWYLLLLALCFIGLDSWLARRIRRWRGGVAHTADGPSWTLWLTPYLALCLVFFWLSLPYADPVFHYNIDFDNYLAQADALRHGGPLPLAGPQIVPTAFRLGPLYLYLLSGAQWLTGGDLFGSWKVLLSMNLLGLLLFYALCVPQLGRARAFLATSLILCCPQIYLEQQYLFWHNHYNLVFMLLVIAGLARFHATGDVKHWYLALGALGLALHMHATAVVLLAPLLTIGALNVRRFRRRQWLVSGGLLLLTQSYLLAQWSSFLRLGPSLAAVGSSENSLSAERSWSGFGHLLGSFSSPHRVWLLVGVVVSLALIVAWRARGDRRYQRGLAIVTLSGLAASTLLFAVIRPRWFAHYSFIMLPFAVLPLFFIVEAGSEALVALGKRLDADRYPRLMTALFAGLYALLIGVVGLNAPLIRAGRADRGHYLVQSFDGARRLTRHFRLTRGIPRDDFDPRSLKVHGFLCTLRENGICSVRYLQQRVDRDRRDRLFMPDREPGMHHNVFFTKGAKGYGFEAYQPCLRVPPVDALTPTRSIPIQANCRGPVPRKRFFNLITRRRAGSRSDHKGRPALRLAERDLGLVKLFPLKGEGGNVAVYRTREPFDLSQVTSLSIDLPTADELADGFESQRPYTRADFGLTRVRAERRTRH